MSTTKKIYTCSYCASQATHFGINEDLDVYCGRHLHLSWDGVEPA